jgi:uncharacterized protein YcfL
MKKLVGISIIVMLAGFSSANAQSTVKKAENTVSKDAQAVGNKTAEISSKGKAKTTDKTYKDKEGPNGETIYIDKHSKYYWVDKKGHKVYMTKDELKDKQ